MKKYTNKILIITLIAGAVLMMVIGTVEMRKAFHKGEIKTIKEWREIQGNPEDSIVHLDMKTLDSLSKVEE